MPRRQRPGRGIARRLAGVRRHPISGAMAAFVLPQDARAAPFPTALVPQLCRRALRPPCGKEWIHEIKADGYRSLLFLDGLGGLRVQSRNGHDTTSRLGAAVKPLAKLEISAVLDGEIAAPDDRGVTRLPAFHAALRAGASERLAFFAFDLLHLDGYDLRPCPLEVRKKLLKELIASAAAPRTVFVDHFEGDGATLFDAVVAVGAEGIVSKRRRSLYRSGQSSAWLKVKRPQDSPEPGPALGDQACLYAIARSFGCRSGIGSSFAGAGAIAAESRARIAS